MYLDNFLYLIQPFWIKFIIFFEWKNRLQPEFCLAFCACNMNMHTFFFIWKKIKSVSFNPKYCRTHITPFLSENYTISVIFTKGIFLNDSWRILWLLRSRDSNFNQQKNRCKELKSHRVPGAAIGRSQKIPTGRDEWTRINTKIGTTDSRGFPRIKSIYIRCCFIKSCKFDWPIFLAVLCLRLMKVWPGSGCKPAKIGVFKKQHWKWAEQAHSEDNKHRPKRKDDSSTNGTT